MNQQQLNKIDEEFDDKFDRFTRIVCMSGDCNDIQNYEEVDYTAEVRDFLHSKLQEVIKDERERIIELIEKEVGNFESIIDLVGQDSVEFYKIAIKVEKHLIEKLKSLQTNE